MRAKRAIFTRRVMRIIRKVRRPSQSAKRNRSNSSAMVRKDGQSLPYLTPRIKNNRNNNVPRCSKFVFGLLSSKPRQLLHLLATAISAMIQKVEKLGGKITLKQRISNPRSIGVDGFKTTNQLSIIPKSILPFWFHR